MTESKDQNCHICGEEPYALCDGCGKLACEEHFTEAICDTCIAAMEAMSEEERAALDQECIELLERGQLP